MKRDIILAGVGGQGILSIAAVIGLAAVEKGMFLKQAEVHGMSQRGGAVQSHLRISDREISSDLITEGHCDLILSVEPMEALRYLPFLCSETGWVISSDAVFRNIPEYPEESAIEAEFKKLKRQRLLPAAEIARRLGSVKASNMVMLGAASDILGFTNLELEAAVSKLFTRKGEEVVHMNVAAIQAGKASVYSE